mgnify:CR=1 FL=1
MAYKMKGSPFQRNFGVGASPAKQKGAPATKGFIPTKAAEKPKKRTSKEEKKLPTFRKGDVSIKQYDKKGNKRYNIKGE